VVRVGSDGVGRALGDTLLSDLVTVSGQGTVALSTRDGDIELTDGSAPADGRSVAAHGNGQVLLQAGGGGVVRAGGSIEQAGALSIDDPLRLLGPLSISSGIGGAKGDGALTLLQPVDGSGGADDRLVLRADGAAVHVAASIGALQPLAGLTVTDASDVRFDAPVRVTGDVLIQATGHVQFAAGLVLDGGRLIVSGADRVSLGEVTLAAGDLQLQASGPITLGGALSVSGSAALTGGSILFGAAAQIGAGLKVAAGTLQTSAPLLVAAGGLQVEAGRASFASTAVVAGAVDLRVDALQLSGAFTGGETLTLRPLTAGGAVTVSEAAGSAAGLALNAALLSQMRGFASVSLGDAASGAMTVDTATLAALDADQITLTGTTLGLNGSADAVLGADDVSISASQSLSVQGRVTLLAGSDLRLSSGGAVTMTADSLIDSAGGQVQLQAAGDIVLGRIDVRGKTGQPDGGVVLVSTGGTIRDAAADEATNIQSGWLQMQGRGPLLAAGQSTNPQSIDVAAPQIAMQGGSGTLTKVEGSDGRTRWNLIDGDRSFQQLVAEPLAARTASASLAPDSLAGGDGRARAAAWAAALGSLGGNGGGEQGGRAASGASGWAAMDLSFASAGSLAAMSAGHAVWLDAGAEQAGANGLLRAWALGTSSQQPAATGLRSVGSDRFDIWEDDCVL